MKCYSSHPTLTFFPSPFDESFHLKRNTAKDIEVNARVFSSETQTIMVTCVDVDTREKVQTWILRLTGTPVADLARLQFMARCGIDSDQKFNYQNRNQNKSTFEFLSSDPEIMLVSNLIITNLTSSNSQLILKFKSTRGRQKLLGSEYLLDQALVKQEYDYLLAVTQQKSLNVCYLE